LITARNLGPISLLAVPIYNGMTAPVGACAVFFDIERERNACRMFADLRMGSRLLQSTEFEPCRGTITLSFEERDWVR
jgi:hypothetical protein